jgi:Fe-S-cluster containining protein
VNIDFDCTMCGKCCHGLRVPLTVDEAIGWLGRGDDVQVMCEAIPWPEEPPQDNLLAAHKRGRSFAATSGSLPTRIAVTLVGSFAGACPNLLEDMRCGIYEERPLVCRIYPAEINPFVQLDPANKECPPEAWAPGKQILLRDGTVVDTTMKALIQASRERDVRDVHVKERVCAELGLDSAALASEGFLAYSPVREALLTALEHCRDTKESQNPVSNWQIASSKQATVDVLESVGAVSFSVEEKNSPLFEYLGFNAA